MALSCAIGCAKVREYLQRAERAGLSWPSAEGLADSELEALPFPLPLSPTKATALAMPGCDSAVRPVSPQAGWHLPLRLPPGLDDEALALTLLREHGV